MTVSVDKKILEEIKAGYKTDTWCKNLVAAAPGMPLLRFENELWFLGNRLVIPCVGSIRESIFQAAHDALGHFGFDKSYATLRDAYYWPKMRRDLELSYIPACRDCQRFKATTASPLGPLHPLPVPDARCDSVAIDFVGPLPEENGLNCILSMTDRLNSDIQIVATRTDLTARGLAELFFDNWYCENGLPLNIVCDRDKLFVSKFWKHLTKLIGVKVKMSSAFHPQTDAASERSNKTINQCLRYHVDRNQKGWSCALRRVRFDIMNTVNKSTGFSPFYLRTGRCPRVIPPLVPPEKSASADEIDAYDIAKRIAVATSCASDNMIQAKIQQAAQANSSRSSKFPFAIGDRVQLSTKNRRKLYKEKGEKRAAKFTPRYDGPYEITGIHEATSNITISMPNSPQTYNTFHASELLPFHENDDTLFPSRKFAEPPPVVMEDGEEEWLVDEIIAERRRGRGRQYLVQYTGYGQEHDRWIAGKNMDENEALDVWLARNG